MVSSFRHSRGPDPGDAGSAGGRVRETPARHPRLRLRPHGERGQTGKSPTFLYNNATVLNYRVSFVVVG